MLDFFENSWITGIGGGIISGLIVFFVTNLIFSKRQNKEYLQKVRLANNEVLYAIRPLIVSEVTPKSSLLQAVLSATAMKYELEINDLVKKDEIANELSKEILDNVFLTAENKLKYCEITESLRLSDIPVTKKQTKNLNNSRMEFDLNNATVLSLMFSVVTASTVGLLVFSMKSDVFQRDKAVFFFTPNF